MNAINPSQILWRLPVVGLTILLLAVPCLGEEPVDPAKAEKPRILIEKTPPPSLTPGPVGMGGISGKVFGVNPKECRVIIYALGNRYYVQPTRLESITVIDAESGTWNTLTHGGYEYVALLVKADYKPAPETVKLPAVRGAVLAMARKAPEEKEEDR